MELVDQALVRYPHTITPRPLLKGVEEDLLQKGAAQPSKFPYAKSAFLLPKSGGGYRMVVDYRKIKKKICFDSYR
jgi:hypothetical protein